MVILSGGNLILHLPRFSRMTRKWRARENMSAWSGKRGAVARRPDYLRAWNKLNFSNQRQEPINRLLDKLTARGTDTPTKGLAFRLLYYVPPQLTESERVNVCFCMLLHGLICWYKLSRKQVKTNMVYGTRFNPGESLGQFFLVMCRWPLRAPTPL